MKHCLLIVLLFATPTCKSQSEADLARVRKRKALLAGTTGSKAWRMTRKRKAGDPKDRPLSGIQARLRQTYRANGTYETKAGGYAEGGRWKLSDDGKNIEIRTSGGNRKRLEIIELSSGKLVVRDRTELMGVELVYLLTYEPIAAKAPSGPSP